MRRSRVSRRRAAVLIGIHLLFALHLAHLWLTGSTLSPLEPSEAMEFSKHSVVNAGLVFFSATILLTLVFGRFFCGWGCHIVALQDLCRAMLLKVGIRPRPLRSRALALVPLFAFLYMFVWPLAARLWVGDDLALRGVELRTSDFWKTFPGVGVALLTFGVCGFLVVYLLGAKGFCTYACPYGAAFGAVDRLAPLRIRVSDACEGCGHCTATCSSNVDVAREVREFGAVVDPGCMKCLDCVSVCPKGALSLGFGKPAVAIEPRIGADRRRPRRWPLGLGEELLAAVAFLAAFLSFRGLYGRIPFLLSLGIAGALAFVVLQLVRLARRRPVALPGWAIARDGRLQPKGWLFLAAAAGLLALWASAAGVTWLTWRASSGFAALAPARAAWFAPGGAELRADAARSFARVERSARAARAWSLIEDPRLAYPIAWGRLAAGDPRGFLAEAERADRAGLRSAELVLEAALVQRSLGDPAAAQASFERVAQLHPHLPAGWAGWAECLALGGKLQEARAVLSEGRRQAPESARLAHDLAVLETVSGELGRAIELMREALALDPSFAEARAKLATLLEAAGSADEARRVREEP